MSVVEGISAVTSFVVLRGEIEVERRTESPDASVTHQRREFRSSDSSKKPLIVQRMPFPGTEGHHKNETSLRSQPLAQDSQESWDSHPDFFYFSAELYSACQWLSNILN